MDDRLPHEDGSGRGLDDGDCIHCGSSGSLEHEECPTRLRARVNELESSLRGLGLFGIRCVRDAPTRDPMLRELCYNVAMDAYNLGLAEERV